MTCYKINKIPRRTYHFCSPVLILCIVSTLFLAGHKGQAQKSQNSTQIPKRIVLPWQSFNLTYEFLSNSKEDFEKARNVWMNQVINRPTTLAGYLTEDPARQKRLSNNRLRQLSRIHQGEPKGELLTDSPLTLQPLICPIGNQMVLFTTITHTTQHNLVASGHHAISRQQLQTAFSSKAMAGLLSEALLLAWNRALLTARKSPPKNDALQTGLRSGREITRKDYGSGDCLNLLLAEKLVEQQFTVTQHTGLEYLASLQFARNQPSKSMRNTRIIILNWSFSLAKYPAPTTFPLSLKMTARLAESVFGSSITKIPESDWQISKTGNGTLQTAIKEEFLNFLTAEKEALTYENTPKISRVYGSWVYVDKGRAWGLKLLDRLTVRESPGEIRGHVIKFFGPELKLKNINGQTINEGAIIFIRKGQRLVKPGQSLVYDQTEFPTPWPPGNAP